MDNSKKRKIYNKLTEIESSLKHNKVKMQEVGSLISQHIFVAKRNALNKAEHNIFYTQSSKSYKEFGRIEGFFAQDSAKIGDVDVEKLKNGTRTIVYNTDGPIIKTEHVITDKNKTIVRSKTRQDVAISSTTYEGCVPVRDLGRVYVKVTHTEYEVMSEALKDLGKTYASDYEGCIRHNDGWFQPISEYYLGGGTEENYGKLQGVFEAGLQLIESHDTLTIED